MDSQFPPELLDRIERCGVVAVLILDSAAHAVPLAKTLLDNGIDCMELTLRTDCALESLALITRDVPKMTAGIGTVLTTAQVKQVQEAGGAFAVAPGLNAKVVQAAQAANLPFAPGIVTPSDVELALELGCRELKFFPAEPSGGLNYLNSLAAPYQHLGMRYVPLGGVNEQNMTTYLSSPHVWAVGGSWLAPRDLIAEERFSEIGERAARARAIADSARL
jgi:2-dehydro-3-deoxyphosphogluconate aldolase/(4S)-4-hydroxy-2-oxoglutarate aldolase